MESPRLMQQDKLEELPESGDSRPKDLEQSTEAPEQRLNEDHNLHNEKERKNVEDSEIVTSKNQNLSETTKSDRKSTDEVEESSSQPVQVEKIEDPSVDVSKGKDQEGSNQQKTEEKISEVLNEQKDQGQELIENKEEGQKNVESENVDDQKKEEDREEGKEQQNVDVVVEKKKETLDSEVKNEEPVNEEKKEDVQIDEKTETVEVASNKQEEVPEEPKKEEPIQAEVVEKKEETTEPVPNQRDESKTEQEEQQPANTEVIAPVEPKEEESTQETQLGDSEMDSSASKSGLKDRSPKVKNLHIDIRPTSEKLIVLNESMKHPESPKTEEMPKPEGDSPDVKKYYSNQNLTELIQPESSTDLDQKSASAVLKTNSSEATGEKKKEENKEQTPSSALQPQKQKITMEDFHKITSIGRGSYGEVFLVKKISNNKVYALKAIDKNFMKKENKEYQVFVEKEVLMKLNHPNIIKIFFSFQDKAKLYFVLEYVSGGEFSDYLRIQGKLNKEQIIFFAAEIINILEYIHTFGIAHRDMKPENLLLTAEGHIKCIDFGTARFLTTDKRTADLYKQKKPEESMGDSSEQKRNHRTTFVGTAQYVSPEMLEGSECGAPADLWALGCMVYLMAVGSFPFMEMNEYLIFQKIKTTNVKYPDDIDLEIRDLIQRLLVKEPEERLGAGKKGSKNDYEALKKHPLFRNVDFEKIHEQKPPVVEIASPHKRKSHGPDQNSFHSNNNQVRKHCHSEDLTQENAKANNKIFDFQTDKVRVILSGLVLKKCGWLFFKPRQLILNSKPRLVYYDPDSNQLKGEIPLAPTTKAELESKTKFVVKVPNRTFVFKEMEHSAEKWVEIINTAVQQLYSKKTTN